MNSFETTGSSLSAGARLRQALVDEKPLQVIGTINAYHALMAERTGYRAIYLSGGSLSASLGLPDLGVLTLDDIITEAGRLTDACSLPLLVDIDTGFGAALNIARTIKSLIKAGAAACHIEDQVAAKRCGHRPGKAVVPTEEMVDRLRAAVDARTDGHFVIMARTDAIAIEGVSSAIDRACAYVAAGADMIFVEAATDLSTYRKFVDAVKVPVLANITEFGSTPLFSLEELASAGVSLVLYPLSAFRAMNKAALAVFQAIRRDGTQKQVVDSMQTRAELYDFLDYYRYEKKLDELFSKGEQP